MKTRMSETSLDAYRVRSKTAKERVYQFIIDSAPVDKSAKEISEALNMPLSTVTARINELRYDDKKIVCISRIYNETYYGLPIVENSYNVRPKSKAEKLKQSVIEICNTYQHDLFCSNLIHDIKTALNNG